MKWYKLVKHNYRGKNFQCSNPMRKSLKKGIICCSMKRTRVMIWTPKTLWPTLPKMSTMTLKVRVFHQVELLWTLWLSQILHLSELLETKKPNHRRNPRLYPRNLQRLNQSPQSKLIQIQVIELICPKALSSHPQPSH